MTTSSTHGPFAAASRPRSWSEPRSLGLGAGALLVLALGCPARQDSVGRTPHPPGAPERGQLIDDAVLDRELPPAPRDALAYEIQAPLRNGRTVAVKKRWIWIPDGTRLVASAAPDGQIGLTLPRGTKLWKEFYLATPRGPRLIERRLLRKLDDSDQRNGWMMNGGWRMYAAHYLPPEADGVTGFENRLEVKDQATAPPWAFPPDAWMPTRLKAAATFITFVGAPGAPGAAGAAGAPSPYVFPGKVNCDVCHGGASGAFASTRERAPVLSFGAHPAKITPASLQALVQKGWIAAPPELLARLQQGELQVVVRGDEGEVASEKPAAPSQAVALGGQVLELFQNNCLSCHNRAPLAAARDTGFVLAPGRSYGLRELGAALSGRSQVMGSLGVALLTPGQPAQSELWLRLQGQQDRRRMPPAEGGVPEPDQELADLVGRWIKAL